MEEICHINNYIDSNLEKDKGEFLIMLFIKNDSPLSHPNIERFPANIDQTELYIFINDNTTENSIFT